MKHLHGMAGIEWDANKLGFHKIFQPETRQARWVIKCSSCGGEDSQVLNPKTSPETLRRIQMQRGWQVEEKNPPVCDKCTRLAKVKTPNIEAVPAVKAPSVTSSPQPPNGRIARRLIEALDQHFDETTRLYRDGYDDEAVAKECECSTEAVIRMRREAYGELADDPKVVKMRSDLSAIRKAFESEADRIVNDLARISSDTKARLDALEQSILTFKMGR